MSTLARPVSAPSPITLGTARPLAAPVVSPWRLAWRRLRRNQLALLGGLTVLCYTGLALGADALAPYSFQQFDFLNVEQDPSVAHFFGTDFVGRDMLTLLLYGARVSVSVAIVVPLFTTVIGVTIGLIAGYAGGWLDSLLMRVTDVMFAFPAFLFMVLIVSTFGRSLGTIFVALGVASWPTMARIVRGGALQIKNAEYMLSARAIGVRPTSLLLRHLLPNLTGTIAATATLGIPAAIISEAFLTYLGIGVEPATPSWGMLINDAQQAIFWHPTLILIPALAISSLTLAFSFLGDGLHDALDPRLDR